MINKPSLIPILHYSAKPVGKSEGDEHTMNDIRKGSKAGDDFMANRNVPPEIEYKAASVGFYRDCEYV